MKISNHYKHFRINNSAFNYIFTRSLKAYNIAFHQELTMFDFCYPNVLPNRCTGGFLVILFIHTGKGKASSTVYGDARAVSNISINFWQNKINIWNIHILMGNYIRTCKPSWRAYYSTKTQNYT